MKQLRHEGAVLFFIRIKALYLLFQKCILPSFGVFSDVRKRHKISWSCEIVYGIIFLTFILVTFFFSSNNLELPVAGPG